MSGACGSPLDMGERALRYFSRSVGEIEFLCNKKKMGKRKKIEMCYCVPSAAAKYVTRPLTGRQHEREEKTNWQLRTLATVTMATREKVISSFASHDKRHWAPRGRKIHFHSLSLFRVSFSSIFRISPSSKGRYYTQKHP